MAGRVSFGYYYLTNNIIISWQLFSHSDQTCILLSILPGKRKQTLWRSFDDSPISVKKHTYIMGTVGVSLWVLIHLFVCPYVCIYVCYIFLCICLYVHVYVHVNTGVYMCVYMHMYMCTFVYKCVIVMKNT